MKNYFLLLTISSVVTLMSCNSGGMSATSKRNLEVNDAIMKAYEAGDFDKMGDYIAVDAIDHAGETGDVVGLDNIIAEMKKWKEMSSDMKSTESRSLADDEFVFTWATVTGTMNGNSVTMKSVDISKFKDGKAVEHWMYMDPKDMAMMMPQPGADTTAAKN